MACTSADDQAGAGGAPGGTAESVREAVTATPAAGACAGPCKPGKRCCSSTTTLLKCGADGAWESPERTCGEGYTCDAAAGACVAPGPATPANVGWDGGVAADVAVPISTAPCVHLAEADPFCRSATPHYWVCPDRRNVPLPGLPSKCVWTGEFCERPRVTYCCQ